MLAALGFVAYASLLAASVQVLRWLVPKMFRWRPRAVYHVNDDEGHVIYVGSCNHIRTRMMRHKRDQMTKSRWFPLASARFQITLEPDYVKWYTTQEAAFDAEDLAIKTLRPVGNRRVNRRERVEG